MDIGPEFNTPPLPPREVSRGYILRQLTTSGLFIVGAVFAFIGLVFTIVSFGLRMGGIEDIGLGIFLYLGIGQLVLGLAMLYLRLRRMRSVVKVMRGGQAIKGKLVSVGPNYSVTINNRHPWRVRYTFRPLGGEAQGEYETLDGRVRRLAEDLPLFVLYNSSDPSKNTLYPNWELAE